MSSDTTTPISHVEESRGTIIAAYYSLSLVTAGTVLNTLTFLVLCRATFRNTQARPILHYMRVMAIFDILMLYGWNIDHYLTAIHGFAIQRLNIPLCRFSSFLNYFAPQTSAWLRVFVSLDRYLSLSRLHRTWFSRSKSVLIIIALIMTVLFILNFHFFITVCYYTSDGSITVFAMTFEIYPLWDYINLAVYNCAPFLLMVIFNSGVIYHLIRLRNTSTVQNSRIQHRSISITLVITTFMFLIMTIPATVGFAFFYWTNDKILYVFDALLYTYHILSFPLYMITFDEFRQEVISIITCKRRDRIGPQPVTNTTQQTGNTRPTMN